MNNTETFDPSYKGGATCLEGDVTYTMTGGTISNHKTKFGGAEYIGNGAVFTMEGGTITGCEAEYGGAIYIACGGTLNLMGDSVITKNKARYAPAIYAETGAILNISGDALIDNNSVVLESGLTISTDTLVVGEPSEGLEMHYAEFGSYPQTFVGAEMNEELEEWYSLNSSSITLVNTYKSGASDDSYGEKTVWKSYKHPDGNVYARGLSLGSQYTSSDYYTYLDGSSIIENGSVVWFKVEPIQWLILNYDAFMLGEEDELELMSYLAIDSNVPFYAYVNDEYYQNEWYESNLRSWLYNNFYDTAFTEENQSIISLSTLKNNVVGEEALSSDGLGVETEDYVYCVSYYELQTIFESAKNWRCSPTDYALSNYCYKEGWATATYPDGGSGYVLTRSSSSIETHVVVNRDGGTRSIDCVYAGVRPVLKVAV